MHSIIIGFMKSWYVREGKVLVKACTSQFGRMMDLRWVQQCWHGQAEWGMMAKEWKIHFFKPHVSAGHRHPDRDS